MLGEFGVEFREMIKLAQPSEVVVHTIGSTECEGFSRQSITYEADDGRQIPAFLFTPAGSTRAPRAESQRSTCA
jgi:hypothetical protein